jgi:hypothetical protein
MGPYVSTHVTDPAADGLAPVDPAADLAPAELQPAVDVITVITVITV